MKKLILLACLLLISPACGISLRAGDHLVRSVIEYDYDILTNSYHGHGGNLCCECNTTVKNAVKSKEGLTYCLACWEQWMWDNC